MFEVISRFLSQEDGAVTVDWVVLTAAIVGMGAVVISTVAGGALDHSTGLGAHLLAEELTTTY
jgi:Flp pilus assembly pilin Flp